MRVYRVIMRRARKKIEAMRKGLKRDLEKVRKK